MSAPTPLHGIDPKLTTEIESCGNLYLREVREPRDHSIVLVIDEAIASAPTSHTEGAITFHNVRHLEVMPNSRSFELTWGYYIAYSVMNDFFALPDEDAIASGRWLRVYTKSRFLEYLSNATWGEPSWFGPVIHIGIICLNHTVHIASHEWPKIRLL